MIKIPRVCVILGLRCNLSCKYCYRDFARKDLPYTLSESMRTYLATLNPNECEGVTMSGGEPLIYWETVKECLSLVPDSIHKKIMTNGTLLTPEIVDYVNQNNIEVQVSHDGESTFYTRGIDIFNNAYLLGLIRNIKNLTIASVISSKNNDVIVCYDYIRNKLHREDFHFTPLILMDTGNVPELINGFDYDLYSRTFSEFMTLNYWDNKHYKSTKDLDRAGFNLDLHGNILGLPTLTKYGTIHNTYEECKSNKVAFEDAYCRDTHCPLAGNCSGITQPHGEHYCKSILMKEGYI